MTNVVFETKTKTSNSKVKRKRNKMLKTNRSNQRLRSYLLLFFWTETIPFRLCFRSFFSVFLFHFFFRSGNWLCQDQLAWFNAQMHGHSSLYTCLLCNAHIHTYARRLVCPRSILCIINLFTYFCALIDHVVCTLSLSLSLPLILHVSVCDISLNIAMLSLDFFSCF